MKVYTKTGDEGLTGLYTGERVPKDSLRVEVYGTVDELDSALGMARAFTQRNEVRETILELQQLLSFLMGDIASIGQAPRITGRDIQRLEDLIDSFDGALPPISAFIIPGDTPGAACLDLARTVARRSERQLWRLSRSEEITGQGLVFLNRLSDLCFVLSRVEIGK